MQRAVVVQAEFELGVGNDDALGGGELGSFSVQLERDVADALGQFLAHFLDHVREVDVFVVHAEFGLGGGREDGLGQLAGLLQAGGQLDAADGAGGLVVFPAGTDQVAAGNRFHQDRLQALDHDGAAAHLVHFVRGHHVFGLHARGVVRQDVGQLLQPEFESRRWRRYDPTRR
ncbi:hypothetical protein G6F31_019482 [Rhizopus arrhizus]|nr:hypothetical protein G6F31_019482 [Rhizopus arrhizus]